MDFVPMDYGWAEGAPGDLALKNDACVKFFQGGDLIDFPCDNFDVAPMCQAL